MRSAVVVGVLVASVTLADASPVAITFVLEGSEERFMRFDSEDDCLPETTIEPYQRAFDKLALATRLPAGSEAQLVTYSAGAAVKMPFTPVEYFGGAVLGSARDYRGQIGRDLVAGLEVGLLELEEHVHERKILILIGDGTDTRADYARGDLERVVAAHPDITIVAVHDMSVLSSSENLLDVVTPHVVRDENWPGIEHKLERAMTLATWLSHWGNVHISAQLDSKHARSLASQTWRWLVLAGVMTAFAALSTIVFRRRA